MALLAVPPFLILVFFLGALVFATQGRAVSEGFISWLKSAGRLATFLAGPTGALAVKLTRWITHNVGAAFSDAERLATTWLSGLYQWADLVITNALEWPLYIWKFQNWLLLHEIPKLLRAIPKVSTSVVHAVTTRVVRVERTVVKLPKLSKAVATAIVSAAVAKWIHPYLSMLRWIRSHFHALTQAIDHALPLPTVPSIPNVWKRIRALEKKLAVPFGIGVVAAALARLGLGWIRCNRVRKLGKGVCGLDNSLIDKFLLDALAIFGIVSVVEFAEGLQAIEEEAVGIMGALVREWP